MASGMTRSRRLPDCASPSRALHTLGPTFAQCPGFTVLRSPADHTSYLISLLLLRIGRMLGLSSLSSCDVYSLRSVNALSLLLLAFTMLLCRQEMESQSPPQSSPRPWRISISAYALHTALNIALFPLLFFFSGLYYTDVLSTAVVAAAFFNCLVRMRRHRSSVWSDTLTFIIGILAILMRQTNVFWIVVYMGGLEAVHAIKCLKPTSVEQPHDIALLSRLRFNIREWSAGAIYDPPLSQAWPEGTHWGAGRGV